MVTVADVQAFIVSLSDYGAYILFAFLIGFGLYFTFKLKGMQLTKIRECSKLAFSGTKEGETNRHISSYEAFAVGLGARVGVGNIAGVATAIIMGGPGAVFWMWIFAIIGAATSYMECTLGQVFKEKKEDGFYHGGPAYYIQNGLKNHKFAVAMAVTVIALYGIGFIGVQSSNASSAFVTAFDFANNELVIAAIIAAIAAAIIFGGIKRVAKVSVKIVPVMAIVWLVIAAITVIINYTNIPEAFILIFESAFGIESVVGGGIGAAMMWGLKRGVFSNEAGIGSVPNISSSADVKHPAKQGLIQSLGVLIDTLVVCSATAFIILTYADYNLLGLSGAPLVQGVLSAGFMGSYAPAILSIILVVFAFSSIIGYYSMSEANVKFMTANKNFNTVLKLLIVVWIFISCVIPLDVVWALCDLFMIVMGVLNMIAVGLLAKYGFEAYHDYFAQKNKGIEEPVFDVNTFSGDKSGITCWDSNRE